MGIDFSFLFHQSSKDRSAGGRVNIPLDSSTWPEDWKTIFYKEYPRLKQIALEREQQQSELFEIISSRASRRDFSGRSIPKTLISSLLKYSCGVVDTGSGGGYHRAQPSGGGRYPIEVYVVVFSGSEDVPAGVYHYNVKKHALDVLWQRTFSEEDIGQMFTYPWAKKASFAIILSAVFERNQMKYGERGYRHVLIEAGAILQNIYLVSEALELKCCAIDGVNEPNIEKNLDIDGYAESVICSLVCG